MSEGRRKSSEWSRDDRQSSSLNRDRIPPIREVSTPKETGTSSNSGMNSGVGSMKALGGLGSSSKGLSSSSRENTVEDKIVPQYCYNIEIEESQSGAEGPQGGTFNSNVSTILCHLRGGRTVLFT